MRFTHGFLFLFALAATLPAQVSTGTIKGAVTDASGAAVPGAQVKVLSEGTGVARNTASDSAGNYVATNLPPGPYRVETAHAGFQPQAKVGLVLSLDQTMTVNFTLQPGEQKQVVTVVSRSEQLVEAATSSLGQTIEETQIRDLPLNGRNFQQLIGLNTGAQPGPQGTFSAGKYHLNGGRSEGNAFLIDGLDISSHGNDGLRTFPSLEALGEFKIITNAFSAEYGRSLSGVVSTHIKSGTNELHGTIFHFLRNRVLDARNFFAPTRPKYIFNQYGGSAGGPIIKDKFFFFADFQGTKTRTGGPQLRAIPTPAQRSGDFSSSLPAGVVWDPLTTPRVPFAGNRIPRDRFDRPSALMFSLLPDPNLPGPVNFLKVIGSRTDIDAFDTRADYHFNERNRLSAVITFSNARGESEPLFPRISGHLITPKADTLSRSLSLNYTRVMGTASVNELIVGWKRDRLDGPITEGMQHEPEAGIRFLNNDRSDPNTTGFPMYLIPGYSFFGGPAGGPVNQVHNIPQLTDNFSFTRGTHSFKTGVALRFRQFNLAQNIWPRGLLVFLGLMTSNLGAGGDPVASALLGYPFQVTRDFSSPWGERLKEYGAYFQDDWKVSRRLTLNLGVRYDLYPQATEAANRLANFDLDSKMMILAGRNGVSSSTLNADKNNFSPHLGFAYLLTSDGKTVVRGGYGIGYLLLQTAAVGTGTERLTTNQPFKVNFSTVFNFLAPSVRVSDGLQLPVPDPNNPSGDVNFHLKTDPTPYMQQWNFNIQRTLPRDFLADIAYAGSRGVHLTGSVNLNQAPPGAAPSGPRSLISPRVNAVLGLLNRQSSNYHSLQAKLQRRFAQGLYVLGAYTYAKAIDNGSFTSQGSDAYSTGPQDARNWNAERGRADFDFTHRFTTSYIYELPVGRGRRFLGAMPAAANYILGGWQINGITVLQSGNVFTPVVSNPRTNGGPGGSIRPDRIGEGSLSGSQQTIQRWFDKSAFAPQGAGGADPYHFGNSGRNILRGPKLVNFDFSLFKEFPIGERRRVEFRTEFFNLFNTPNFLMPDKSVDTAIGGVISAARDPRLVQFGLKIVF